MYPILKPKLKNSSLQHYLKNISRVNNVQSFKNMKFGWARIGGVGLGKVAKKSAKFWMHL
jgi:hypothetical protein